ncbi:MAG TPA: hemerythrin domain-containing protein [Myxococcaceae bacterium]|nr:hemerythrin domain-containing protein [Myxococcaceae bacterium]
MNRPNRYQPIHKALRAALFDATVLVARTEFAHPGEASMASRTVATLLDLLDGHAHHEEELVMPLVGRHAPALVATLETEHNRLEGLQAELRALLPRTCSDVTAEREAAGQLLGRALTLLVADHLRHMDREETEAMPVLWAHCTEQELDAMDARIRAAVPPERMPVMLRLMLPAMSTPECAQLLSAARAQMPPPVFAQLSGLAREALGPERWASTARRVGLDSAASSPRAG